MSILWFRRGLRLHDNSSLLSAVDNSKGFAAVYIFDPPGTGPKPYHFFGFLLECLEDLNKSLRKVGSKLHIFIGDPVAVFRHLHASYAIEKICFEQDCEPIWHQRDNAVKSMCAELRIECIEKVSHTLWDPMEIIILNGGTPPLTYDQFVSVAMCTGDPAKPVEDVNWAGIKFLTITPIETVEFKMFTSFPTLDDVGVKAIPVAHQKRKLFGGETMALEQLALRLKVEESAFMFGVYRPLQAKPDLLESQLSMSAAIALGAISVRLFYWKIRNLFDEINKGSPPAWIHITGQLIWREYFYTMGRENPNFGQIENNPLCLALPWREDEAQLERWKNGQTGYPFIDAGMRQLLQEGWIHHTVRNAVAVFLTRGDLWLNWEPGHQHFLDHLVDGDWAVNAGNWMWLSSSAFDRLLDCSLCIHPVDFGRRLEPSGDYIRRYIPELVNYDFDYIHEPWKAPLQVQRAANCIIGKDYPERMVIHEEVSKRNGQWMKMFRQRLKEIRKGQIPDHCQPSTAAEINNYFFKTNNCVHVDSEISMDVTGGIQK